ncbi:MAG: acyl carrier protein [Candidatus Omnitrophica bacterium]|nr:acyl carrier protein [Candidatus Omnitrophota bacterium]
MKEKKQQHLNKLHERKKQELFVRVQKVIANELKIKDISTIKLNSRFKEDLGVDSLASIELIMGLESEFNLEISDEDSDKLLTVKNAVDYLENKV